MRNFSIPNAIYGSFFFILLSACVEKVDYEYWLLSRFNLQPTALEEGEPVKLLYTSQGPDFNLDKKYYIQLVAVSQKTGDTVNILTTSINNLDASSGDEVFNYYGPESDITLMSQRSVEELKQLKTSEDMRKLPRLKIDRVARDPQFDDIADNDYPTVIGCIAVTTKTENLSY